MSKIHLLDIVTINKIAAGEVVARPVSVVKELVENSIDAGAKSITIKIKDGGKTSIQIIDDGCGMDSDDAKKAFIRHATSKITSIEDLFFLDTMGFRGEAIPSIASVSKFTLQTAVNNNQKGLELSYIGGELIKENELSLSKGTTITVENLFYNIPARLKFLKQDKTELVHIIKCIQAFALEYPQVAFSLSSNQTSILELPGAGNIEEVVSEIFTHEVYKNMKKIEYTIEGCVVQGFVSNPSHTRSDRDKQFFFVNHRLVNSATISKALRDALNYFYPPNRQAYIYLSILIDSSEVDVNVHPAKSEVKFRNDSAIYKIVKVSVNKTFENDCQPNDFNVSEDNRPVFVDHKVITKGYSSKDTNEYKKEYSKPASLDNNMMNLLFTPDKMEVSQNNSLKDEFSCLDVLQYKNTYLIFEYDKSIYVIDQHIAHERILYEKLKNQEKQVFSQELLLPETIHVDAAEKVKMDLAKNSLEGMGFSLEEFGKDTYILRAVPDNIPTSKSKTILQDLLSEDFSTKDSDKLSQRVLISLSCKAAVKAGDHLSPLERTQLVQDWLNVSNKESCPHGRNIAKIFVKSEIDKWFGRCIMPHIV